MKDKFLYYSDCLLPFLLIGTKNFVNMYSQKERTYQNKIKTFLPHSFDLVVHPNNASMVSWVLILPLTSCFSFEKLT